MPSPPLPALLLPWPQASATQWGSLFSEEGPEIRSLVVAEVPAMAGWLPDDFGMTGGAAAG